jgi:VWFA-related protein
MQRLLIFLTASVIGLAQSPAPVAAPNATIRIDVNLVQVDAVVTNSKGKRVADLQSSAFEILQDGKPQAISSFSYIENKPSSPAAAHVATAKPVKGEVPPPPEVFQPIAVGRTMALVVDDLGLSGESIPAVKSAIKSFVDQQMRPGDLVAIVRTSAGMGALQQFTTEKSLLYASLARVKYTESRVGVSSFAPLGGGGRGRGRGVAEINHMREESFTVGSLAAIRYVVNSMAGLPGRKSVVLFTENIRTMFRGMTDEAVSHAVQQLSDAASRAAVVIHAVDPRGVEDYNISAADDTRGMSGRRRRAVAGQRQNEEIQTSQGSVDLAQDTGGLFLNTTNDLAGALKAAADDSDGYYLIGYRPDTTTFDDGKGEPKFHKIEVKVKTAGLHVRSREGFLGQPGSANLPIEHTREAELNHALQSPFTQGAIHPRLTGVFSNSKEAGSFIVAMLYFPPNELRWSTEADGNRKAAIDVTAAAFDENGLVLAPVDTTFHLVLSDKNFDGAMKKGMTYTLRVPVTKAGPYLLRAAVRDPATEGTGSAQQYIEVPDIAAGHLALSGILLGETAPPSAHAAAGNALAEDLTQGAARRSFPRGSTVLYGYQVFNAQSGSDGHPELEVQCRLFREGAQVWADKNVLPVTAASDPKRLDRGGRLTLGRDMKPGAYVLQVIMTDKLAKGKFTTAIQSVDFELEP